MKGRRPILPGIPLLMPTASFVGGILWAAVVDTYAFYCSAMLALLVVIVSVFFKRPALALICGFACIGMLSMSVRCYPEANVSGQSVRYAGVVDEMWHTHMSQRAVVRLVSPEADSDARVFLRVHASMPLLLEGDTVRFTAILEPVAASGTTVPGEYSPRKQMWRYGVSATADIFPDYFTGGKGNFLVSEPEHAPLGRRLYFVRQRFVDAIYASGVSDEAAAFLTAVLAGDSGYLDDGIRSDFATAGVAHVLALSGTHVAVAAFLLALLFFPLRLLGLGGWTTSLTIVALWIYAFVTGLPPSVTRAVIMATTVGVARMLRRDSLPLNSLCLAALLILLWRPRELFFPGFQLSFVAVAAIIMFSFETVGLWRVPAWLRPAWVWFAVCLSAVFGTSALSAWYFHLFPLYFLLANIPVACIMPVMMCGEIALMAFGALGIHIHWLAAFTDGCYRILAWCVSGLSACPGAAVEGLFFSGWLLAAFYGGMVALWLALMRRSRAWAVAGCMLVVFFFGAVAAGREEYPEAEAYAVECSYATVAVVREGNEARILTDAPPTQYENVRAYIDSRLADYALSRGVEWGDVNCPVYGRYVSADSACWHFGSATVVPVGLNKNLRPIPFKPQYALISVRYFGRMSRVREVLRPDSIILSEALSDKMRTRYITELDSLRMPYRIGLPSDLLRWRIATPSQSDSLD